MSRALYIFTEIESKGAAYVDDLISQQVSEELFLDYKCVSTIDGARTLSNDDKKNFGKAVSGFGNSEGGVVIWGVDCRSEKGAGDVPSGYQADVSSHLKGFNPIWFKSILEGLTSGVTLPAHQGVRHICFSRPERSDGVVATYIPAGMSVPYRSLSDGKDTYYIRAGSDFRPAPHAILAALFGQRPQPIIEVECKLSSRDVGKPAPESDHPLWLTMELMVKNVGRGMADDLFVLIEVAKTPFACNSHPFKTESWQTDNDILSGWSGPRMAVTRPLSRRLPPGGSLKLLFDLVELPKLSEFSMEITAGSPGGPSGSKQIYISRADIEEACATYSETPRRDRHKPYIMSSIDRKLSQAA